MHSFSYDNFNVDPTTRRSYAYNEDNYSQFSGHEEVRRNNTSSAREVNYSSNDNNPPINQGREVYTQKPREILPNSFGFVAESLAGSSSSSNGGNINSVTQRPFNQQTTTTSRYSNRQSTSTTSYDFNIGNQRTSSTKSDYDYNVYPRTTAPTYGTNRETTTRKSTYFKGDLPFLNNDEDGTSVSY